MSWILVWKIVRNIAEFERIIFTYPLKSPQFGLVGLNYYKLHFVHYSTEESENKWEAQYFPDVSKNISNYQEQNKIKVFILKWFIIEKKPYNK